MVVGLDMGLMMPFCVRDPLANRGALIVTFIFLVGGIVTMKNGWNGSRKLGWLIGGVLMLGGLAVLAASIMTMIGTGN